MKPSTITLSVLLLAAVGYAAYLQTELNRLQEAGLAVVAEPEVASQRPEPEQRDEQERLETSAPEAVVVQATPTETPPPSRENWEARRAERMKQMVAAFEDPAMRVDMIERQMNRVDSRYAAFFKTLNLSSEDLDTLRTLMAEQGVVGWEMRMRSFGADTPESREEMDLARELQREMLQDQIVGLLGEENAAALQDYSDSLPYRGEVEALASSLSFTETPLSPQQTEALVGALRDVSSSFEYSVDLSRMRGREAASIDPADIDTFFQERATRDELVLQAAAESLSDAQLAAYAERQLAERERDRRQMEFMQQNPGGFGRGGPRGGGGFRP
ncbi:hypothetical protein QEH56_21355 [Pelagicoccus enzymogenes]|uniref:hypothetical protein n=1 Tax=Pelagicoccus enzymogenes TaxID=2773457 RepID=UPI00280D62E8|nr:hypothetical protein [Pelagicoccus enzymogenes]MDQ8200729.1 hypothetical protein [Pelagicoccus enzymogenes]